MKEKYWKCLKIDEGDEKYFVVGEKYKEERFIDGWEVDDEKQCLLELICDTGGGYILKTQRDWKYEDFTEYLSEHFEKLY
jgi:hypothetical protein